VEWLVNVSDEVKQPNQVKRLQLVGSVGRDGFCEFESASLTERGRRIAPKAAPPI
jgi:hypothetical protein